MCNLYANLTTQEAMRRLFDVSPARDRLGNTAPLDAIFRNGKAPVVRLDANGERELIDLNWGFRRTNKSKRPGGGLIKPIASNNARDENVRSKYPWKFSFPTRRCLVPATSFCEHLGKEPAEQVWFGIKGDEPRPPFAFAGMWQVSKYETKDGPETCETHTVITTTANDVVRPIHEKRMPVILDPLDYERWMYGSMDEAERLLRPFPSDRMHIVARGVGLQSDDGTQTLS